MMCHIIGFPPISTIGLGLTAVSSESLVPKPPARMTAFMRISFLPASGPIKWFMRSVAMLRLLGYIGVAGRHLGNGLLL
jgi:hypothetical protein